MSTSPPSSVSGAHLATACGLAIAALATLRHPVVLDDAYITFRYAANLAAGEGLVFNPGETALSTTAPGLAALLSVPAFLGLDVVVAARALCSLAVTGASLCLFQLGRHAGRPFWGAGAGLLLALHPDLARNWGNEASLLMLAATAGWLLAELGRPVAAGVVLAAGCAVRPDFVLLAALVAGLWAWRAQRGEASWVTWWRFAATGGAVAVVWLAFVGLVSGEVVPHTLEVKQLQVEWIRDGDPRAAPQWRTWWQGVAQFVRESSRYPPFVWWAVPGLLLSFVPLAGKGGSARLWTGGPGLWALAHLAAYALLDVPGHHPWYLYPVWLWSVVAAASALDFTRLGLMRLLRRAGSSERRAAGVGVALAAVIGGLCAISLEVQRIDLEDLAKFEAYRAISEQILERTGPSESMMLGEIGEIGYLTGRRVVDTHALIHPGLPPEDVLDVGRLVARFEPDLIVDEGWIADRPDDYYAAVSSGTYRLEIELPNGDVAVYEQIAGEGRELSSYVPAVLRRAF